MTQDTLTNIQKEVTKISTGLFNLGEDVKEVKADVKKNRENMDTVLSNQDWMIGALTRLDQERLAIIHTLEEYGDRIKNLEAEIMEIKRGR